MQKVLVVSRHDLRQELAKTVLGRLEVEFVVAGNAAAGRKAMRAHHARLVIVALGERRATEEFVKRARRDKQTRNASLLAVLPTLLPKEEKSLRKAGASAVVAGAVDPFRWNGPLEKLLRLADRRAAEIPVRFWVWYRFSGDEAPTRGRAMNVSARGMLLETDAPIDVEAGTRVEAEFTLPGRAQALGVVGRVVRDEGGRGGHRRFAIEYVHPTPAVQDALESFVNVAQLD
jgi:hypothetical protein